MRLIAACWLAALLAGCPAPGGADPAADPAVVDRQKITLTRTSAAVVTVSGAPGAVTGGPATTVTLTVGREPPVAFRSLLHLSAGHVPVTSAFATLDAARGFAAVALGDAERPVLAGDVLAVTPVSGVAQAGFPIYMPMP